MVCDESSGAMPELTRGTCVLPIPTSEFGVKTGSSAPFSKNRPTRNPSKEGRIPAYADAQFPSWEESGVGFRGTNHEPEFVNPLSFRRGLSPTAPSSTMPSCS